MAIAVVATGDAAERASHWVEAVRFPRRVQGLSLNVERSGAGKFETVTRVLHPWLDRSGERSPVTWRERADELGLRYGTDLWHLDFRVPTELWCWEGQLDEQSRSDLIEVLEAVTPGDLAVAVFYGISAVICGQEPILFGGQLRDVGAIYDGLHCSGSGASVIGPQSWWALDGSWLVETGYDDTATDVHGSAVLAQLLLRHPTLETLPLYPR